MEMCGTYDPVTCEELQEVEKLLSIATKKLIDLQAKMERQKIYEDKLAEAEWIEHEWMKRQEIALSNGAL